MTAAEFFANKTDLPTPLKTEELSLLPLEVRERAFFMAQVTNGEILQGFRDVTAQVLAGDMSPQEARRGLREHLTAQGYLPEPGKEGGLQDLSSVRRMNVVLDTNISMARNFAAEAKQTKASRAFPVKLLTRLQDKREKRNWEARWAEAYGTLSAEEKQGASLNPPMAKLGHPIWAKISRFGTQYAPFDFNSGMGTLPKGRTEAKAAGISLGGAAPAAVVPPFNEALQATPKITAPEIRQKVSDKLQGIAEWRGDELVFASERHKQLFELARANPELTPEELVQLWLKNQIG